MLVILKSVNSFKTLFAMIITCIGVCLGISYWKCSELNSYQKDALLLKSCQCPNKLICCCSLDAYNCAWNENSSCEYCIEKLDGYIQMDLKWCVASTISGSLL